MDYFNFAIDLDGSNVRIYKFGMGIVLSEKALVIVSKKSNYTKVVDAGDSVMQYVGKLDKSYQIVSPIKNGRIIDIDICAQMINMLLEKLEDGFFKKKRNIVFLVPCGLNDKEISDYRDLGYSLSSKEIAVVTKVLAISKYNSLKNKLANMILYIGEDFLDVAVVYDHKIIKGYTVDLGINNLSEQLTNYIMDAKGIEVSDSVLTDIRNDMATILPNDVIEERYLGVDAYSKVCTEFTISSLEVLEIYLSYINELCDIIDVIIKSLSKEVIAELKVSGIIVAGELTELTGLSKYFKNRLGVPVEISDKPRYSALLGIGHILGDKIEVTKISVRPNTGK